MNVCYEIICDRCWMCCESLWLWLCANVIYMVTGVVCDVFEMCGYVNIFDVCWIVDEFARVEIFGQVMWCMMLKVVYLWCMMWNYVWVTYVLCENVLMCVYAMCDSWIVLYLKNGVLYWSYFWCLRWFEMKCWIAKVWLFVILFLTS